MPQADITAFDTDDGDGEGDTAGETFVAVVTGATWSEVDDSLRQVLAATRVIADSGLGAAERDKFVRRVVNQEVDIPALVRGENNGRVGVGRSADNAKIAGAVGYVTSHDIPHFFVNNLVTLGESPGEIADRVRELVDAGVEVHVVSQGFDITEDNVDAVLGVLDGLDAAGLELQRRSDVRDVQRWLPETAQAGRPPLGYEKVDGELVPGPNIEDVRAVISMRLHEDINKRQAADRLGVSPRTITRAEENADRYGLEGEGDTEE
ncbi:helix-turn-helix domain-containing protein [Haloarchaeobius sp. FL176]|uniref:helix-turn-helix domain-containing protein n=1 Tax=Haloarchaeobius sp. FL176 TaxID=2967129 RepID=UPI0021478952|nr:helix-turn-helix domain-containing protein [Haloarchaeobius sp. FL176]